MVIVIRSTHIISDPRTCALIAALEEVTDSIGVLCWRRLSDHTIPPNTEVTTYIPFIKEHGYGFGLRGIIKFASWWRWATKKVSEIKPTRIIAIDLDAGVVGLFFKKFFGVEYHYDQADPMSARFSNPILIKFCQVLEKIVVANADSVSFPAISRDLGWNSKSSIIENQFVSEEEFESLRMIEENPKVLFYGGLLIPGRGIEEIIEIPVEHLNGFRIEVAGYGPLKDNVLKAAREKPHIFFHGELPHRKLLEVVAKSRAILAFYDPKEKNHANLASGKINEANILKKIVISNHGLGLSSKDFQLIEYRSISIDLPILLKKIHDIKVDRIGVPFFSSLNQYVEFFQKELR